MERIAKAVVLRAFLDMKGTGEGFDTEGARSFLTKKGGEWARSREYWCALADLDPDYVREVALRHMQPVPLARRRKASRVDPRVFEVPDRHKAYGTQDAMRVLKAAGFKKASGKPIDYEWVYYRLRRLRGPLGEVAPRR